MNILKKIKSKFIKTETEKFYNKIYQQYFPGGEKQIVEQVRKIVEISNNKLDIDLAKSILLKGKAMFFINKSHLYDYVKKILTDKLDQEEIELIVGFIMFEEANETIVGLVKAGFNTDNVGYDADEIPNSKGEFGRCLTNPIPVKGLSSNEVYLNQLKTNDGKNIKWNRIGSSKNEWGYPIDIYELFTEEGKILDTLYISPYNQRVSSKAPCGFRIDSEGGLESIIQNSTIQENNVEKSYFKIWINQNKHKMSYKNVFDLLFYSIEIFDSDWESGYSKDLVSFEFCCLLLHKIDFWLHCVSDKNKNKIMNDLSGYSIIIFSKILQLSESELFELLKNRINLYEKITKQTKFGLKDFDVQCYYGDIVNIFQDSKDNSKFTKFNLPEDVPLELNIVNRHTLINRLTSFDMNLLRTLFDAVKEFSDKIDVSSSENNNLNHVNITNSDIRKIEVGKVE